MSRPTQEPHPLIKHPNLPVTGSFAYSSIFFQQSQGKVLSFQMYHTSAGPLPAGYNANTFATQLSSQIGTQLLAVLPTTATFLAVLSHCHQGQLVYTGNHGVATAGSAAAPALPDEVAVVVQKQTAMFGPWGRGRFFLRCVPASFVGGEYLTNAALSAYQALITAMMNTLSDTQGLQWNLAHYVRKVIPPATLGQLVTVTGLSLSSSLFSARRSRPRRT